MRLVAERERRGDGESSRPHALDIYERVCEDTAEELRRPREASSTRRSSPASRSASPPLAVALATVSLTPEVQSTAFIAALLYPIGYIAVIIGRSQFFTENTLYPVMLTMQAQEYLSRSARLWVIVFTMNLVGAFIFAEARRSDRRARPSRCRISSWRTASSTRRARSSTPSGAPSWPASCLRLVAWLVEGCDTVTGRVAVIWSLDLLRLARQPRPLHRDDGHGLRRAPRRRAEHG